MDKQVSKELHDYVLGRIRQMTPEHDVPFAQLKDEFFDHFDLVPVSNDELKVLVGNEPYWGWWLNRCALPRLEKLKHQHSRKP